MTMEWFEQKWHANLILTLDSVNDDENDTRRKRNEKNE